MVVGFINEVQNDERKVLYTNSLAILNNSFLGLLA